MELLKESAGTLKRKTKAPVVKQTLTSMYRIANANPLLLLNNGNTQNSDNYGINNIKLPKSLSLPHAIQTSQISLKTPILNNNNTKTDLTKMTKNQVNSQKKIVQSTNYNKTKPVDNKNIKYLPHQTQTSNIKMKPHTTVSNSMNPKQAPPIYKSKRKSLSAEHFERKREMNKFLAKPLSEQKKITKSLNDLGKKPLKTITISPVKEEHRVTFKTPEVSSKRSLVFTPTPYSTPCSSFSSTPGPALEQLQDRLKDWLLKQKTSLNKFNHLKCFGLLSEVINEQEENKENIEVPDNSSYEDLNICNETLTNSIAMKSCESEEDIQKLTQDALLDLHQLILEGYPLEQSEAWLGKIRQKYDYLEDEPQYWECRAAIEQSRGNITSAVECLRTAIVQGAEVNKVDNSLEQLLHKFSLLNIATGDSTLVEDDKIKKDRARIVLDARSVFKSSIIQFAIQERAIRKNLDGNVEKKFLVTPVRRSTRATTSKYRRTPGIQLCTSLRELGDGVRENIDFQGNSALIMNVCNKI